MSKHISIIVNVSEGNSARNYRIIDDVHGLLGQFVHGPRDAAAIKVGNKVLDSISNILRRESEPHGRDDER
jgi:hypothetical protein